MKLGATEGNNKKAKHQVAMLVFVMQRAKQIYHLSSCHNTPVVAILSLPPYFYVVLIC